MIYQKIKKMKDRASDLRANSNHKKHLNKSNLSIDAKEYKV